MKPGAKRWVIRCSVLEYGVAGHVHVPLHLMACEWWMVDGAPQTMTIYSTLINKSTQKACGCAITFRSSASYVSAVPSEDARITWANYDRYKPTFNLGDRQHLAMRRECCGIYAAPADSPAAVWFYRMEGTDWDRTAKTLADARTRYLEKYRHGPKRKDSRYSKRQKRCVQPRDEGQEGLLALALPHRVGVG